jgi:mannose-6-phosphate isomerase-like protein (cupin superfamily)
MRAMPHAQAQTKVSAAAEKTPGPPQRFAASHLEDGAFDGGLRRYAQYRDLGIKAATRGLAQAHVIRFVPPCIPEEVSKWHTHDVEFQMIYVLKGWIKSEFEGEGAHTFKAGSCWLQPPRIKHRVLDYSDDCEVLEVILPADFETVEI